MRGLLHKAIVRNTTMAAIADTSTPSILMRRRLESLSTSSLGTSTWRSLGFTNSTTLMNTRGLFVEPPRWSPKIGW